jgi:hypothetical protein
MYWCISIERYLIYLMTVFPVRVAVFQKGRDKDCEKVLSTLAPLWRCRGFLLCFPLM